VARRRGRRRKKLLDGSHLTQKLPSKQVMERKLKEEMEVARRRGRRRNWFGHILSRNCLLNKLSKKDKGGDGRGKKTRKKT